MSVTGTGGVSITWSDIHTRGANRDLIARADDDITLLMGVYLSAAVITNKWYSWFTANFQIQEVRTKQVYNHYWISPMRHISEISQFAPNLFLSLTWSKAHWAGVKNSVPGYLNPGDGMYLYRPYFILHAPASADPDTYGGSSEYSEGEEHFFLLESSD